MDMLYDEIFYDSNEPTDSTQGRSIVSLIFLNNSLGVSWYNELNNSIQTTAIASNMEDFESIIQSLKQECFPTLFLLHPKLASNSSLIDIITVPTPLSNNQNYEFNVPKSSSWQIETSFNLILTYLNVREFNLSSNLGVDAKVYQNLHHLSARVDINNPLVKQSLGALIVYIKAKILVLDNESGNVVIASITVLNWRKYMKIDDNSLRSLQIFTRDVHPNALKENQHSKEGFSLFSLMDRTISLPGRQRLKELMMRPLIDKSLIEERQNLIECILKLLKEGNVIKEISKDLSHIHDIRKTLLRIKKAEASYLDWNKLYYSIESGVSIMTTIQEYCNQKDNISSLIKKFIDSVDLPQISELNHLLSDILDCKKSTVEKEVYIRDGYDNELDDIRSCLESLPSILFTTAHEILDTIPLVKNITIQYMTHVGYLIAVDETEVHLLADETSLFEFIYKQDSTYFYKHPIVVQLDDKYGDVVSSMKDRQKQVLLCLEDVVLDHEVVLQTLICNIAELDAFISLATISKELKFSKPTISEIENIIIRNGRHPLQELTVDTFVPNDTYLSQEKFIGIITGPNNSGKSVYVKQVGVIVYLAQIGSFVPCELAIIGLCDSIMTRVSSVETISSMQSSFTIDLTQVGFMIRNATKRSLLLLDEFGKNIFIFICFIKY